LPCVTFIMSQLLSVLSTPEEDLPSVMMSDVTNKRYLNNAAMGLLMRCLDHTEQTVALCSAVGIAKRGSTPVNSAWTTLLCKCILKMTKTLRNVQPQPDFAAVLLACHEFLRAVPARQRQLDADAVMRSRAVKLLVNELSSMDAVDLSSVPEEMDSGDDGIRGLLQQLNDAAPAATTAPPAAAAPPAASSSAEQAPAAAAAATTAAREQEKLSASGWRLPTQEQAAPAASDEETGAEDGAAVEDGGEMTEPEEVLQLQYLVARLHEEECREESTIEELREYLTYPLIPA
jgi:hypothetical protein